MKITETEVTGVTFESFKGKYCSINVFCYYFQNG